ncbi:MAG TPA: hypothetical protein VN765_00065 [Candidatus Acidoferrum sp.]|nr:hypothetical protein [Candidatus Acidoferrum sp.]
MKMTNLVTTYTATNADGSGSSGVVLIAISRGLLIKAALALGLLAILGWFLSRRKKTDSN